MSIRLHVIKPTNILEVWYEIIIIWNNKKQWPWYPQGPHKKLVTCSVVSPHKKSDTCGKRFYIMAPSWWFIILKPLFPVFPEFRSVCNVHVFNVGRFHATCNTMTLSLQHDELLLLMVSQKWQWRHPVHWWHIFDNGRNFATNQCSLMVRHEKLSNNLCTHTSIRSYLYVPITTRQINILNEKSKSP